MSEQEAVNPASYTACAVLETLIAAGVRHFVVSPGARSQAFALELAERELSEQISLHVRVDERSAAFFALGIAQVTGVPAAVVVTSGSAVANLAPAVMEAHAARVPLFLITADRPHELSGVRANQTANQCGMFTDFLRYFEDLAVPAELSSVSGWGDSVVAVTAHSYSAATGEFGRQAAGPVQLNVRLREPLSDTVPELHREQLRSLAAEIAAQSGGANLPHAIADLSQRQQSESYVLGEGERTVVIAGAGAGAAASEFARAAGLPLLAEVVSGARQGREAIVNYQLLLGEPETIQMISRIIVFGHPTITREVAQAVRNEHIEAVVIDPHVGENYAADVAVIVRDVALAADYNRDANREWLRMWQAADHACSVSRETSQAVSPPLPQDNGYRELNRYARQKLAEKRAPLTREMIASELWLACWPHDSLVLAASRMVRELDRVAGSRPVAVYANRGVAGIDGTIATARGVSAAAASLGKSGVTRLLVGDLALLHDVGSLVLTPGEPMPRLQIFVVNDEGGTIFERLEVFETASVKAFERVMLTPHTVDIENIAAGYGWRHSLVRDRGELTAALLAPFSGPEIIEMRLSSRTQS